jgi:hypothetical protein
MVDRVVSEMAFRSRDSDGRRRGSTHRQAAQLPEVDFGWKCVAVRVCGNDIEDGLEPFLPGFGLIARAEVWVVKVSGVMAAAALLTRAPRRERARSPKR